MTNTLKPDDYFIAPNLLRSEVLCHCSYSCGVCAAHLDLLSAWKKLRSLVGIPLTPTSVCRCRRHNTEVGGAATSQHLFGKAMDLKCDPHLFDLSAPRMVAIYLSCGFRGLGFGMAGGAIHLDVRPGDPVVWQYGGAGGRVRSPYPEYQLLADNWLKDTSGARQVLASTNIPLNRD